MKRVSLLLLAILALGCGRKVVVHPDKLATKGDGAWRISGEPGAPPPATAPQPATAPLPPTSPAGTPTAPPGAGTPSTPPASPRAPLPPSTPPPRR